MRKKKFLLALSTVATTLLLSACGNEKDYYQQTPQQAYDYAKFKQTDVLKVEVPQGKAAVVTFYGDTLYVLDKSQEVMVPYTEEAVSRASSSDPIAVTYEDASIMDKVKYTVWGDLSQVIAFEDSKDGDYDYNDVVLHTRVAGMGAQSAGSINIQPVALGGTKVLGLGAYLKEANGKVWRVIFSNDIRKDFFSSRSGFINTEGETGIGLKEWYRFDLYAADRLTSNILKVNWFILDGNTELFAVSEDYYSKSLDSKGHPYGLVFTNIHSKYSVRYANGTKKAGDYGTDFFWYPRERQSITEVYPDFDKLFDASSNVKFADVFKTPNQDKCVKVMILYPNTYDYDPTNDKTFAEYYDNDDERNLYWVRPNTGYFYYNNGGVLDCVSIDQQ